MNKLHEYTRTLKTIIDAGGSCWDIHCGNCPYCRGLYIATTCCARNKITRPEYVDDARKKLSDILSRLITEE